MDARDKPPNTSPLQGNITDSEITKRVSFYQHNFTEERYVCFQRHLVLHQLRLDKMSVWIIFILAALFEQSYGINNGLGRTPQMGSMTGVLPA